MPTYDFICDNCDYKEEKLVSMSFPKISKCPKCNKETFFRCIGSGCGLIFNGPGCYCNDHPKEK